MNWLNNCTEAVLMLNQKRVPSNNNSNYNNDSNSSCSLLSSYTMCQALLEIFYLY